MQTPERKLDRANVTPRLVAPSDFDHTAALDCWQGWFDGAAFPNPGRIGLGAVLLSPAGERHELSTLAGASGCNNEAELLALLALLALATELGAKELRLHGDSDFAIRAGQAGQAGQGGERRALTEVPRLLPLLARLDDALERFEGVSLVWVPRHRNGEADRLSRLALGLPHKVAVVPGRKKITRRR